MVVGAQEPVDAAEADRALLLTDIVDSTELAQQLGDAAMTALWVAHDRAARDLLRRWRGREIDRSDGFLLVFDSASDAVAYALDYHRALSSLTPPLTARAGLHVGPVLLRANSIEDVALGAKRFEVEGLAKSLAARVMSLARGGQTLISAAARQALGDTALRVQSHGHWRMKGVDQPAELFQIGDAATDFAAPRDTAKVYRVVRKGEVWVPWRDIRYRLPADRDEFVGRGDELRALQCRFDEGARLVSLLGAGGSGKTRLATRFAWTRLGDFVGGCWFCDLAQAHDVDGIVSAVARGLDVPLGKDDPVLQLGNAIAGHGDCLIILDNFEQVARFAESTLGRWLDRAGSARFLVTSREVLGIPGEQAVALSPLSQAESEALFVRRAKAARSDFKSDAADLSVVGALVRLLDGLPLAIELCAARVRVMSLHMLLQRMDERFRLLTSGSGRRDRQSTLRATFDWSWDLLAPHERMALAQLSVFAGGFSLASAEAVLDLTGEEASMWVPDVVQSLVDKSLVVPQAGQRFGLLTSVKEYAGERLRAAWPMQQQAVVLRHGRHFAQLAEDDPVAARAGADLPNLVSACRASVRAGEGSTAVGALRGAWAALHLRGPFRLGVELAERVLGMDHLTAAERAWAAWVEALARRASGKARDAQPLLESALDLARKVAERPCELRILNALGSLYSGDGRLPLARTCRLQALELARALGDRAGEWEALDGLGTVHDLDADPQAASNFFEAALQLARRIGDRRLEGGTLGNLGVWHGNQGRFADAGEQFEASLQAVVEVGDRRWEGNARCNLGVVRRAEGRLDAAREHLTAALQLAREIGLGGLECMALGNLGLVEVDAGQLADARSHYEQALVVARRIGDRRTEGQFLGSLGLLQGRQGEFDSARCSLSDGEAALDEVHDRLSLGILLAQRAEMEGLAGMSAAARAAARRAAALAVELAASPESELGKQLQRVTIWLDRA